MKRLGNGTHSLNTLQLGLTAVVGRINSKQKGKYMQKIKDVLVKLPINQAECRKLTSNISSMPNSEKQQLENYKMLTIEELKLQEKSLDEKAQRASLVESIVTKAFDFLGGHYRNTWGQGMEIVGYKPQVEAWTSAMKGLTQEQFEYGKQKISSGECYKDFPPNAGQFVSICKSKPEYFKAQSFPQSQQDQKPSTHVSGEFHYWYKNLNAEQKTKVYEGAVKAWPALEEFLKMSNESCLDEGLERNMWFTRMVQAFMSYYRINSLRDLR